MLSILRPHLFGIALSLAIVQQLLSPLLLTAKPLTQALPDPTVPHASLSLDIEAEDVTLNLRRVDFWGDHLVFVGTGTPVNGSVCLSRDDFELQVGNTTYDAATRDITRQGYGLPGPGTGLFTQCLSRNETEVVLLPFVVSIDNSKATIIYKNQLWELPQSLGVLADQGQAPKLTSTPTHTATHTPASTPTPTYTPASVSLFGDSLSTYSLLIPPSAKVVNLSGTVSNQGVSFALERIDFWESLPEGIKPRNDMFIVFTGILSRADDSGGSPCVGAEDVALRVGQQTYSMDDMLAANRFYNSDYPGYIVSQCLLGNTSETTIFVFDIELTTEIVSLSFYDALLQLNISLADLLTRHATATDSSNSSTIPSQPTSSYIQIPTGGGEDGYSFLTLAAWNTELNDADVNVIAHRIGDFQEIDIWALTEINRADYAPVLELAAEDGENADFVSVLGESGGGDRMLAIYDTSRLMLLDSWELDDINTTGNARAPLVLHLQERTFGQEFLFVVNHLYRSQDEERHTQSRMLNTWATQQNLPIIAMGDYNYDWEVNDGEHNHDRGYDLLTANDTFRWIKPGKLVTTQCSEWPCRFNSVLDFVFTAGLAKGWPITAEIVVEPNDFPDDETTSDHRPVIAKLWIPDRAATVLLPTAVPAVFPTAPITATPNLSATANRNSNLRSGPGTQFAIVGSAPQGQVLTVRGTNQAGDWFQLENGSWIAAFLVDNAPTSLPVAPSPALPTPLPVTPTATSASQAPTPLPATATPIPQATPQQANCDPSYPGVCIPRYPPDLDCGEIPYRRFQVTGADPHGFDGDNDGIGCER